MFKTRIKVTTKDGILDVFLARLRCNAAKKLIPFTHRKGRILDIGCGIYPLFLLNTEFREKYAIDRVPRTNGSRDFGDQNIRFSGFDIEKTKLFPFSSEYFEVVSMLAVFEHIETEKLKNILREIHRTLKPGGLFIMTTPTALANSLLNLMAVLRLVSAVGMHEHKNAYSPPEISLLLQDAGFSEERMQFGYFEMFMNIWLAAAK